MSEEEIIKQYANGIVDIDKLVGSLIDKFKTDKTSVDIQQLQLIAEYLIYKADKLQEDNKEYIFYYNKLLKGYNARVEEILELEKENEEIKELKSRVSSFYGMSAIDFISKDKIREKVQWYIEAIKYDCNGNEEVYKEVIDVLNELLGE